MMPSTAILNAAQELTVSSVGEGPKRSCWVKLRPLGRDQRNFWLRWPVPNMWDPMEMEIDVSRNRLLELLARGSEAEDLDYKSGMSVEGRWDRLDAVSLAKDVAAFSDKGGWIVIGASDRGGVVPKWEPRQPGLWDEASLRSKLAKYLGEDILINVGQHEIDGTDLILLQVRPHPDGACVTRAVGNKPEGGKPEFPQGSIFTRHGSKSELINQRDLSRILDKRSAVKVSLDRAGANARAAARHNQGEDWPKSNWSEDFLIGHVGVSASRLPQDINIRMFYDPDFERSVWTMGEVKYLRRNGYVFEDEAGSRGDASIWKRGPLVKHGMPNAHVSITTHRDGWVGVSFASESSEWDIQEYVAWWSYGAWLIGVGLLRRMGCEGELFGSSWIPEVSPFRSRQLTEVTLRGSLDQSTDEELAGEAAARIHSSMYRYYAPDQKPAWNVETLQDVRSACLLNRYVPEASGGYRRKPKPKNRWFRSRQL